MKLKHRGTQRSDLTQSGKVYFLAISHQLSAIDWNDMHIHLTSDLQQAIFRHLEAAYPNEGGGFLLGQVAGEQVQVQETIAIENVFEAEEQYHRYAMTPQDWMRLEDEADERGLTLVGYYHSHPDSPAIPSVYDRDHALPHFTYLITQVNDRAAQEMLAWRLKEDRSAFEGEQLVVVGG